jgi:hypothetical protein
MPDKNKRHTLRVWLQKQKKKDEAKAAAQAATPPVEVTPAAPEVQPVGDGAEQPVESVEETQRMALLKRLLLVLRRLRVMPKSTPALPRPNRMR